MSAAYSSLLDPSPLVPPAALRSDDIYIDVSYGFDGSSRSLSIPSPRDIDVFEPHRDGVFALPSARNSASGRGKAMLDDLEVFERGMKLSGAGGVSSAAAERLGVPQPVPQSERKRIAVRERNRLKQANYRDKLKVRAFGPACAVLARTAPSSIEHRACVYRRI